MGQTLCFGLVRSVGVPKPVRSVPSVDRHADRRRRRRIGVDVDGSVFRASRVDADFFLETSNKPLTL